MSREKNIKAYNQKAEDYDNTLDGRFTEKFKNRLLRETEVNHGDSVLDVGCGNGTFLAKMSKSSKANQACDIQGFGTDISPGMVRTAKARNPQFTFAAADCESIPFRAASMDNITVCAAFHHFPNPNAFATEARRLLKPGGKLYIAEIYLPPVIRHIANIFLPLSKDGDVKFYSPKEIAGIFSSAGFALAKAKKSGYIQIMQFTRSFR